MKKFQEMCQEEFEKIELMARGGQKIVFDGVHNSYGETVIKLYFQLNDPRSLREIQIERDLNLSMVPKIYETGTIEYEGTETLYIIEQKVKGTELRKVLESGKRFSLEEAVTFLEQGLEFIACIENKGIVHRDIKPENIIVMKNREVKIIDFDAAKIYKMYSQKDTRTVGTIGYAAPEQYGEAQSDARTDIYGLGIMMNVMLTGKHPVNEMATGKIGNIIEKCIMVNPSKRYRDVMEVKEKLNKLRY